MASDPGNSDGNKPAGGKPADAPKAAGTSPDAPGQPGVGAGAPARGPFLIISPSVLPKTPPTQPKQASPAAAQPSSAPPSPTPPPPVLQPAIGMENEPAAPELAHEPERLVDPPPQTSPQKPAGKPAPQRAAAAAPLSARSADRLAAMNPPPPTRGWGGCLTTLIVIAILAGSGYFLARTGKLDPLLFWIKPFSDPVMEKIQPVIDRIEALISGYQAAPPAPVTDEAMIFEIKQLLQQLNFPPGPMNGTLDPATVAAIEAYQEAAGLPVDGQPSEALLEDLRSVANPSAN